jgi:hypothetical protein
MSFKEYLVDTFGYDEPIFFDEIKFGDYSRAWIFTALKKLLNDGEIKRFDIGVYYLPTKMPFGDSLLSPHKVIERRFISNGDDVYGYISGLSLVNAIGLTTQMPNILEIATNNEATRVRDVRVGRKRVKVRRSRTHVSKENVAALRLLEIINFITLSSLNEDEQFMLKRFARNCGATHQDVVACSAVFPAKVAKKMLESEILYELA